MNIELLAPEHDAELVEFLDSLGALACGPMVLGYHYPENRDMLLQVLQPNTRACYLAARAADGRIVGVLPGMIQISDGMSCYNSLPFFGPNASVLAPADDAAVYRAVASQLISAALDYARQQSAVTAVFYSPFNPLRMSSLETLTDLAPGAIRVPKKTLFLRLTDEASLRWPSAARRNVQKAVDSGVRVTTEVRAEDIDEIFQIYATNCREYGIPLKPRACLEQLCLRAQNRVSTFVAYLNDRIIAALLVFWGPQTASYYLPCAAADSRHLQPTPLLIDAACRVAIARGIGYWNWESSPSEDDGVYRFKKKWGSLTAEYETVVVPLQETARLKLIGRERLSAAFPHFYVYPYDRLAA